jgi:hypothetical protein
MGGSFPLAGLDGFRGTRAELQSELQTLFES